MFRVHASVFQLHEHSRCLIGTNESNELVLISQSERFTKLACEFAF